MALHLPGPFDSNGRPTKISKNQKSKWPGPFDCQVQSHFGQFEQIPNQNNIKK